MASRKRMTSVASVMMLAIVLSGCTALQEIANLRSVNFVIERVSDAHLAGVNLERVARDESVQPMDLVRVARAVSEGRAPFDFTLHLMAENPEENDVRARMVQMDWKLFLEDRETISGNFVETMILEPGQPTEISIEMGLDLLEFFDGGVQDLVDLALAASGHGDGRPREIRLEATPTIDTPVGPIRYPRPINITVGQIGS